MLTRSYARSQAKSYQNGLKIIKTYQVSKMLHKNLIFLDTANLRRYKEKSNTFQYFPVKG
jgi:hypothetical protein